MRSRMVLIGGGLGLLVGLLGAGTPALAADYPAPHGRCVDETGELGDALCKRVTAVLMRDEKATTDEIAVAVVDTTDDESIETYATGLFNAWGVGKRDRNNGVLLVVAVDDHRLRLETGRGIGSRLDNAEAKRIIDKVITPKFKQDEYAEGVLSGLDAVRRSLGHKVPKSARLSTLAEDASDGYEPDDSVVINDPGGIQDTSNDTNNGILSALPFSFGSLFCLAPIACFALFIGLGMTAVRRRSTGGWGTSHSYYSSDTDSYSSSNDSWSSGGASSSGSDFGGGSSSGDGASGSW